MHRNDTTAAHTLTRLFTDYLFRTCPLPPSLHAAGVMSSASASVVAGGGSAGVGDAALLGRILDLLPADGEQQISLLMQAVGHNYRKMLRTYDERVRALTDAVREAAVRIRYAESRIRTLETERDAASEAARNALAAQSQLRTANRELTETNEQLRAELSRLTQFRCALALCNPHARQHCGGAVV
jgi:hypothetical protein